LSQYNPKIHNRRSIRLKGYDYSQAGLYFITICCQDRIYRFGDVVNGKMILNEYGQIAHDQWMQLTERFPNFKMDVFQIMPNHMHGIISLADPVVRSTLAVDHNGNAKNADDYKNDNDAQNGNDSHNDGPNKNGNGVENGIDTQIGNGVENDGVGRNGDRGCNGNDTDVVGTGFTPVPTTSVSDIVGAYKSLVANGCLKIYKSKNEIMGKLWQRNYYEHIIRNEKSYKTISEYIINNPVKWSDDKFYKK